MLSYQGYEKAVYDSLMEKRNSDSRFNFSVRQKALKGAEQDYFIGTENSGYFGTTFWNIRVGFPGSAGDLINLMFKYKSEAALEYYIQFNQTRTPHDNQNESALELIKNVEPLLEANLRLSKKSNKSQKILHYSIKSRKPSYSSIQDLINDVFKDLEVIIPIVNQEIEKIKSKHPEFIAHQFSDEEFDQMQQKLQSRQESHTSKSSVEGTEQVKKTKSETKSDISIPPINQIFFGPPGTGKTYNTINEALRIAGVDINGLTRAKIKDRYDSLVHSGQIVFTTFHQSMSYEDFIEGIKPIVGPNEEKEISYKVVPGLFKKLCIEATFDLAMSKKSKETTDTLNFSNRYDTFIEGIEERLSAGREIRIRTKSGGQVIIDSISPQGNVIVRHINGAREYTVSKTRLTKLYDAIDSLDDVSNINNEFRDIIGGSNSSAYWSVLSAIEETNPNSTIPKEIKSYSFEAKEEVVYKMKKADFHSDGAKNFILIIDEINRGNVSQIFGELITLLEADKRLGMDESLKATLPYSNSNEKRFGVPPNLYVIGTMNTADRSVEALDTALRRRFSFTEMPPIYDLDKLKYEYAGVKVSDLLKTLNRRIEKLLDRDHLIGHSFFLLGKDEEPETKLIQSFYQNLIPLLQEYFYGDYAKIGAVLGNGFIQKQEDFKQTEFASGFDTEVDGERDIYQIIDYREGHPGNWFKQPNMNFEKAIRLLMNQPIEKTVDT